MTALVSYQNMKPAKAKNPSVFSSYFLTLYLSAQRYSCFIFL
jgi:hypothetical protein